MPTIVLVIVWGSGQFGAKSKSDALFVQINELREFRRGKFHNDLVDNIDMIDFSGN